MRMVCSIIRSMSMRVGEPVRSNGRASTMVAREFCGSLAHRPGPCSGSLSGAMVICVSSWSRLRAMEDGRSLPVSSLYLPFTAAVNCSYACSHCSLTDSSPRCLFTMSSNMVLTSSWKSRSMSSVQNDGRSKPSVTPPGVAGPYSGSSRPVESSMIASGYPGLSASSGGVDSVGVDAGETISSKNLSTASSLMRSLLPSHAMPGPRRDVGPPTPRATSRGRGT